MRVVLITANCVFCCQCHWLGSVLGPGCNPRPAHRLRHGLVTFNNVYMNRMPKQVHTDDSWANKGGYLKSWGRSGPGRRCCCQRRRSEALSSGSSWRSGSVGQSTGRNHPSKRHPVPTVPDLLIMNTMRINYVVRVMRIFFGIPGVMEATPHRVSVVPNIPEPQRPSPIAPKGGRPWEGRRAPGVRKTFVVFFLFFHLARRFWNHTWKKKSRAALSIRISESPSGSGGRNGRVGMCVCVSWQRTRAICLPGSNRCGVPAGRQRLSIAPEWRARDVWLLNNPVPLAPDHGGPLATLGLLRFTPRQ